MRKRSILTVFSASAILVIGAMIFIPLLSGNNLDDQSMDEKIKVFLEEHQHQWRDMNVPEVDGQLLYDIIIKNNYTKALEIGTSTGRSGIYLAWALSKTGGKLTTVEIDERRYNEAVSHFKELGLDKFVDARLADAHELVPELEGPWDFVFIDADKNWYTNYVKAVIPKLETGGCIAAHNVYQSRGRYGRRGGTGGYYEFMEEQEEFENEILPESRSGLSVSYKKKR
jgi:caffeoyl-CoA O-methyltransferase